MKNALQLFAFVMLALASPAALAEPSAHQSDARLDPQVSLRERLDQARARTAPRGASALEAERERSRLERLRPLASDVLGALQRRKYLGDRRLPSAQDRRLGSTWRRQALSGGKVPAGAR